MTTSFYWLILGILAVWRVTHLFQAEDGPWEVMVRIRRLAGASFFGSLLDCFYCLSLWVALPAAWIIGQSWTERGLLWLALSAGAIALERVTGPRPVAPPVAVYHEDPPEEEPGGGDDVLRKEASPGDQAADRLGP